LTHCQQGFKIVAMNAREKIRSFVVKSFLKGDKSRKLLDDTSFIDEGIIDSIGVLELLAFLEEDFKIKVEDEEIMPDNFDSVDKLVTFVESKLVSARK
jgi:acyl carrier protein